MTRQALFGIFAAIWIALSFANVLFHKRASVAARRKWHGWIDLGLGVLFAAFGTYWSWGVELLGGTLLTDLSFAFGALFARQRGR